MSKEVQIVAEIGSNFAKFDDHGENIDCACEQIIAAQDAGATAVKFQLFTPRELFGPECPEKIEHELGKYCLRPEDIPTLADLCDQVGIEFMCSCFSVLGFQYVNKYVRRHKLASPEYTDTKLRNWLENCGKPVIYSLGCQPGDVLETTGHEDNIYLECVSKYPADFLDYDISRMFGLSNWGVSDHTLDSDLAVFARSYGATFFEKHVDFFYGEGRHTPDMVVSIADHEFVEYVHAIRSTPVVDRDDIKKRSASKYSRRRIADAYYRPIND